MVTVQTTVNILKQQLRHQLAVLPVDRTAPILNIPKSLPKKSPAQAWPSLPPEVTLTMFDRCPSKDQIDLARHWQSLSLTKTYDVAAQAASPNWYVLNIPDHWQGELTLPNELATHWPVIFVCVGKSAKVTFTESRATAGGLSVYIIAAPHSHIHWHSTHTAAATGQWYGAAKLDSNSTCQWSVLDAHHGANNATRTIVNHHLGTNGRGTIIGLTAATDLSRTFYTITNAHLVPTNSGDVIWRAVVGGKAKFDLNSWVKIGAAAPQTASFLDQRVLMRAGTAVVRSVPNLVIDAADVAASHRATISPIDQTAKWFLTSRGVLPRQAEQLLIRGFASELMPYITNPVITTKFQHAITTL